MKLKKNYFFKFKFQKILFNNEEKKLNENMITL
jgi:hypothetical protein